MCVACFTTAEAMVINGGGGVLLAQGMVDRARDLLAGRSPMARRQANWDANAAFLCELGIDPAQTLGARPGREVDVPVG